MSVRVMSLVWPLKLSSGAKLVFLALADCANDEGHCWPNMATIARKSSRSERSARMIISQLEERGYITRIAAPGKVNCYDLHPGNNCTPEIIAPRKKTVGTPEKIDTTPEKISSAYIDDPSLNHQEPSEVKSSASDDRLTPHEILAEWNDLAAECSLPKAEKMTGGRLRQAKARLREYPELDAWRRAFRHIHESPFLRGENDRGWCADIDFLLQAKSFTKLTEGSYGKAN